MADTVQHEVLLFLKSESEQNVTYKTDMNIGIYNCTREQTSGVCKHQVACFRKLSATAATGVEEHQQVTIDLQV